MAHGVARERNGGSAGFRIKIRITIMIMNDLVKPSQTKSNPDMPTHRADASGLPDGADAGREARPAARVARALPGGRSRSHLK